MEEKNAALSFEEYFSRLILMNERFRYCAMLGVVFCLLGYLGVSFLLGRDLFHQLNSVLGARQLSGYLAILMGLVILRTLNILRVIKRWQLSGQKIRPTTQFANAVIELSIPSLAIIIVAQRIDVTVALNSPAVFIYFILILLSVLELDFKLTVFCGVVASAEYLVIVFYYLKHLQPIAPLTLLAFPYIYVSKAIILLMSGVIAGLAAQQIKWRALQAHSAFVQRQRIETLFGQQISPQVVDELMSRGQQMDSRSCKVCIMFLDLRGFTQYCDGRLPEDIVLFQNKVLSFMIDAVIRHRGIVNQILGDGFMATFGAPISSGNDCGDAVAAALEIIDQLRAKLAAGDLPLTDVRIGLHYGDAVTGNVGTDTRKQYSVTGNVVNLAARIEQLNKQFGSRLLVSREVLEQVDTAHIPAQPLGMVQVKGRTEPMELFQLA